MTLDEAKAAIQAATSLQATTVKVAQALKDRLAAAPKPADASTIDKAAAALVAGGWIADAQLGQAKAALADPQAAVEFVHNLAVKAAAVAAGSDRLRGGEPIPAAGAVKFASNGRAAASEADAWWDQQLAQYRVQKP